MLSVKQGSIKYHFWVFGMTRPGIEPRSYWPLVNTLTIMPMSGYIKYIWFIKEQFVGNIIFQCTGAHLFAHS